MSAGYWWLSFADDDVGLRGVVVVPGEADTFVEAVARTHELSINPGGQVFGVFASETNAEAMAEMRRFPHETLVRPGDPLLDQHVRLRDLTAEQLEQLGLADVE